VHKSLEVKLHRVKAKLRCCPDRSGQPRVNPLHGKGVKPRSRVAQVHYQPVPARSDSIRECATGKLATKFSVGLFSSMPLCV